MLYINTLVYTAMYVYLDIISPSASPHMGLTNSTTKANKEIG